MKQTKSKLSQGSGNFYFILFIYLFIYLVTHKTLYNMNRSC